MTSAFWKNILSGLRRWPVAAGRFQVAALTLLFFGAEVLWGIWRRLDLPPADTSFYFHAANEWRKWGAFAKSERLAFSPLYCAFLGVVQRAFADAGDAIIVHRVAILLAALLAVLIIMRQVAPRAWAWLGAAWWIALPINWRAFYEVHLFGFALTAIACALAGSTRSAWGRGWGLAVLAAAALLVRNELFAAVVLFGGCCYVSVWRGHRADRFRGFVALTLPGICTGLAIVWMFAGHPEQVRWHGIREGFEARQRLDLQQVYSFGYQQRHPDWTNNPWTEGAPLMRRDFGRDDPTFAEALCANPAALLSHVAWNIRLIPSGLQLAMFSEYSGAVSPDFAPSRSHDTRKPLLLGIATAALWIFGGMQLWRKWRRYGRLFLRGSRAVWTWTFLCCCVPTSLIAIATQRPRPSYIFPLALLFMSMTVVCARLTVGLIRTRCRMAPRLTTWLPLSAGLLLVALSPGINWPAYSAQTLLGDYRRLRPYQIILAGKDRVFCANTTRNVELANYLTIDGHARCRIAEWPRKGSPDQTLEAYLETLHVTDLYLKNPELQEPKIAEWRASAPTTGWRRVASADDGPASWEFWTKPKEESRDQ